MTDKKRKNVEVGAEERFLLDEILYQVLYYRRRIYTLKKLLLFLTSPRRE
jgi:hypothetical protein